MNDAQRAAVERWGQDVCVSAGPGSGKTLVLIERFRWLVETKGVDPRRILAVTFTEKAATEIKQRLNASFASSPHHRERIERAWVSTIHGFCTRLLKENAIPAALDPNFKVLNDVEAKILVRRCAEESLDHALTSHPDETRILLHEWNTAIEDPAGALLILYEAARTAGMPIASLQIPSMPAADGWENVVALAHAALNQPPGGTPNQRKSHQNLHTWSRRVIALPDNVGWRERLMLLSEVPKANSLKSGSPVRRIVIDLEETVLPETEGVIMLRARHKVYAVIRHALLGLDNRYRGAKRDAGLLDFEDLQEGAIALLESNPAIRRRVCDSFDHVLMDELQDTNRLQWRLMNLVRKPGCLFAVGDINQSIYFFRHADPEVFRQYRDGLAERGDTIDELRENYRSRKEVIAAVNAVVPFLTAGVEAHQLTARRDYPVKTIPCIECMNAIPQRPDESPQLIEARWIARRIRELEGTLLVGKPGEQRPARFSDFAILARSIGALTPVQQALDEFGVPCTISGGRTFYQSREIRDLIAWLCVLANPLDEVSLAVVLRSPLVGASDETLLRLKAAGQDLISALAEDPDERLQWLAKLIRVQRERDGFTSPDAFLAQVLDESEYEKDLPARARANIAKLLSMIRERYAATPMSLGELTDRLTHWSEMQSEAEAAPGEAGNATRLMSVHSAKGLEFPIVFVAALRAGTQNREPALSFGEDGVLGASWRHPKGEGGISDPMHRRVCARRRRQEEGEEDRLLYVAMTRAEEHLFLTASPRGTSQWLRRVSDGLRLPDSPKEELDIRHQVGSGCEVRVVFTGSSAANDFPLPPGVRQESVEILSTPLITGQYEAVAPVTSVAQHAFCPRQYFLARYLGYQTKPAAAPVSSEEKDYGEWSASEFGTYVHEMLAGTTRDDAPPEAMELVERFRQSALGLRAAAASRSGREYDFLIEMEGLILRGQIDLWFEESGELILVDYKSDRVEPGEEPRHALRYGPQLRLYAMALQRMAGHLPDHALVWYLRTGAAVEVDLNRTSLIAARRQVIALRESQEHMDFPLREGNHCLRCAFYGGACPARSTTTL
ncbi:MAG: UvrD-helicase domain-containing protein [Candidatus Solibacter usitatus]|nr:UvrD-helicase domain-containing protein [Candidatus Solibacter usitatus]